MNELVISNIQKEDVYQAAKLISKLHGTLIETRQDIFIEKEESWEKYLFQKISDENWVILVAKRQDNIIGVCAAEIKYCGDGKETKKRTLLFIDYIVVDEKYRRLEVGSRLLDNMKKVAKEKQVTSLELNVWGFNKEAIKFYEQNNMKPKRIVYEYIIDKE